MPEHNLDTLIVGSWQSDSVETDFGPSRSVITFDADLNYRLNTYFGKSGQPMVTEGKYLIIRDRLIAKELNKGQPIPITYSSAKDRLTLHLPGEPPTELSRLP